MKKKYQRYWESKNITGGNAHNGSKSISNKNKLTKRKPIKYKIGWIDMPIFLKIIKSFKKKIFTKKK